MMWYLQQRPKRANEWTKEIKNMKMEVNINKTRIMIVNQQQQITKTTRKSNVKPQHWTE